MKFAKGKKTLTKTTKKKPAPLSAEVVVDSAEEDNGGPSSPIEVAPTIDEVVDGIAIEEAEDTVATALSDITDAEIVASKKAKKGSKYTEEEVAEVRAIIGENTEAKLLTNKQLEIAYWIEGEDIREVNKQRKKDGLAIVKSDKASFCMTASFDKAFFLELQGQYKQEDGEIYTLQAFQHAIHTWFYNHINIGNAYARSGGMKRENKKNKVVGVDIPQEWFKTKGEGFLQGYLLTDEGKEGLEIGEEQQRIKRTANKSAKGVVISKEQVIRNTNEAMVNMEAEDMEAMIARLQATLSKRREDAINSEGGEASE
tara:strand:+ start:686 stop:1624 length:939 start_codon:yes stop_codon:yes gene_type:complete